MPNTSFSVRADEFRVAKRLAFRCLIGVGALALTGLAQAQAWPSKPIRIVVGFAPGGTTDVLARAIGQVMSDRLGQPVVIDNKPGASGNIAANEVSRSPADGYTFLYAPTSTETAGPYLFKPSVRPSKPLTPVVGAGVGQSYLVTPAQAQAKDMKSFISYARANPGKLSYASPGPGSLPHLVAELFNQIAGISATHVPYRGGQPALMDVMAGQVDYVFDTGMAFPHVRTGKAQMLSVASGKRSPFFPAVPTLTEVGLKGAEMDVWFGIWSPEGVPPAIHARMAAEVEKALAQASTKTRFESQGVEVIGLDPAQFKSHLAAETQLMSTLIRDSKISID